MFAFERVSKFVVGLLIALLLDCRIAVAQDEAKQFNCGEFVAKSAMTNAGSARTPTLIVQTGHTRDAHVTSVAITPDKLYALTGAQDDLRRRSEAAEQPRNESRRVNVRRPARK